MTKANPFKKIFFLHEISSFANGKWVKAMLYLFRCDIIFGSSHSCCQLFLKNESFIKGFFDKCEQIHNTLQFFFLFTKEILKGKVYIFFEC